MVAGMVNLVGHHTNPPPTDILPPLDAACVASADCNVIHRDNVIHLEEPVRSASGVETGKPCAGQKYRIESSSPNTLVKQFTHTASLQPGLLQGLTIRPPVQWHADTESERNGG